MPASGLFNSSCSALVAPAAKLPAQLWLPGLQLLECGRALPDGCTSSTR